MPCQILYYYRLSRQQLMTSFSLRNGPNQPMHTVHKGVLQQTTNIYGNISTNFTPSDNLDWKFKIQATTIQHSYLSSWSLRINILHRGEESYCLHQQKVGRFYLHNRISGCPENVRQAGFSDICWSSSHNIVKQKVTTYQAFNSVLV